MDLAVDNGPIAKWSLVDEKWVSSQMEYINLTRRDEMEKKHKKNIQQQKKRNKKRNI